MDDEVIYFITEGATEREVGYTLHRRDILKHSKPQPQWSGISREGYNNVIREMKKRKVLQVLQSTPELSPLLLIFDQETDSSELDTARRIGNDVGLAFSPITDYSNLFEAREGNLYTVLHISNAAVGGIPNRDFDGYVLALLQGPRKLDIATRLSPTEQDPRNLLQKAEQELTQLMHRNGFPWTHNKSWLYAYITAFQFRQSHVGFAKEVVKSAPASELRQVFASLIAAWNLLIQGDDR